MTRPPRLRSSPSSASPTVGAQASAGLLERARQRNGGAIEGMSHWNFGVDKFEPVTSKGQCPKKRRAHRQRMHRGTDVVDEPGKGQRRRASAATDRFLRLE